MADAWEMIAIGNEQLASLSAEPDAGEHTLRAQYARARVARFERVRQHLQEAEDYQPLSDR